MPTEEEKAFFKFLKTGDSSSTYTDSLQPLIQEVKQNSQWRKKYMTWEMSINIEKEWAYQEARKEADKRTD